MIKQKDAEEINVDEYLSDDEVPDIGLLQIMKSDQKINLDLQQVSSIEVGAITLLDFDDKYIKLGYF